MLPKDINNITEPVYKRLHNEIEQLEEKAIPINYIDIDLSGEMSHVATMGELFTAINDKGGYYNIIYREVTYSNPKSIKVKISFVTIPPSTKAFNMSTPELLVNTAAYFSTTSSTSVSSVSSQTIAAFLSQSNSYVKWGYLGDTRYGIPQHVAGDSGKILCVKPDGSLEWIEKPSGGSKLYKHILELSYETTYGPPNIWHINRIIFISDLSSPISLYNELKNHLVLVVNNDNAGYYDGVETDKISCDGNAKVSYDTSGNLNLLCAVYHSGSSGNLTLKDTTSAMAIISDTVTEL